MKTEQSWLQQSFSTNTFKVKGQSSLHWACQRHVNCYNVLRLYLSPVSTLGQLYDGGLLLIMASFPAASIYTVLFMTANVSFRYLERRHGVCEDVRRAASFSGPALRTCLGFKEHLAAMWQLRARGRMVALKGQTPSREKCCKKQTKHNGKENLTERNRSVSGGTLMWRTWQKPKDPNTLKRLKVHRYKSQWWFFLLMYLWYIHHLLCFLCFCSLLTPLNHRRIENTH